MAEITNIKDWKILLSNAENGDPFAMNKVAFVYQFGLQINSVNIVEPNPKLAFEWIKKSYETGNIEGMVKYADYLSEKECPYCSTDIKLAMALYEKARDAGSAIAAYHLGIEYRNKQNFEKAFELYLNANSLEPSLAELVIGQCYYYGIGTAKDKVKALVRLESVKRGNYTQYEIDEANYLIGRIYLEGDTVPKSITKARYYLELADADGDHRSAQELLIVLGRADCLN